MALLRYSVAICYWHSGIPVTIPSHEFLDLRKVLGGNVRRFEYNSPHRHVCVPLIVP